MKTFVTAGIVAVATAQFGKLPDLYPKTIDKKATSEISHMLGLNYFWQRASCQAIEDAIGIDFVQYDKTEACTKFNDWVGGQGLTWSAGMQATSFGKKVTYCKCERAATDWKAVKVCRDAPEVVEKVC